MKLEERLAALRQEKGLSQADVAEALDVSRQAISGWERGTNIPSAENLICLARLYDISLDCLLNGSEHTPVEAGSDPGTASNPGAAGKNHWNKKVIAVVAAVACLLFIGVFLYLSKAGAPETDIPIGALNSDELDMSSVEYFSADS